MKKDDAQKHDSPRPMCKGERMFQVGFPVQLSSWNGIAWFHMFLMYINVKLCFCSVPNNTLGGLSGD